MAKPWVLEYFNTCPAQQLPIVAGFAAEPGCRRAAVGWLCRRGWAGCWEMHAVPGLLCVAQCEVCAGELCFGAKPKGCPALNSSLPWTVCIGSGAEV